MLSIPVTILGGSDRAPGHLPEHGARLHALSGYKGVDVRIGRRPLIEVLVERVREARSFGPINVVGPARIYRKCDLNCELLDLDGTVGQNLRGAIEQHIDRHSGPLAVLACDVLPTVAELSRLRDEYQAAAPCALWFPFIPVPDDPQALGAFAWKPVYRLRPSAEAEAVRILPGHLCIFDPRQIRLALLYRLLDLTYRTKNRSIRHRRSVMLRATLFGFVAEDLGGLFKLRAPTRTWRFIGSGLRLARELRAGRLELGELERLIGRIFLKTPQPAGRGIRYPLIDVLSLAEDIDTEEEARQVAHQGV